MKAIYPGSFDPITNGHIDIINRSKDMFDELVIGITTNVQKKHLFKIEERKKMIEEIFKDEKKVTVKTFDGLLTSFCEEEKTNYVIRGLRAVSDYEYELQMAMANKSLNSDLETIFLVASHKFNFLSSSIVKEIAYYHGDISALVPKNVENALKKKYERG